MSNITNHQALQVHTRYHIATQAFHHHTGTTHPQVFHSHIGFAHQHILKDWGVAPSHRRLVIMPTLCRHIGALSLHRQLVVTQTSLSHIGSLHTIHFTYNAYINFKHEYLHTQPYEYHNISHTDHTQSHRHIVHLKPNQRILSLTYHHHNATPLCLNQFIGIRDRYSHTNHRRSRVIHSPGVRAITTHTNDHDWSHKRANQAPTKQSRQFVST